jgi:transposase
MEAILSRSAGLDVHKMLIVATIQLGQADGTIKQETREFGTFPKERRKLAKWLKENEIQQAVMESTGIYWKTIYRVLESRGVPAIVVNARHIKQVPGRKTDVKDSEWLATLGRFGLLRASFIPSKDMEELRLVTRYRMKLQSNLAAEKNRMHKVLDDAGVRLGGVVSDIDGVGASAMIQGLIEAMPVEEIVELARGTMKKKRQQLADCMEEPLSERHKMLLKEMKAHIDFLVQQISDLDAYVFAALEPYRKPWELLQTIPGMDEVAAAVLLVEIGVDMKRFGNVHQFASWAGLCPGNNESAGKRKHGRIRKGNRTIRQILCEVAHAARWTKSQFNSKYKALVVRRGQKRTIVALAHKLLRVAYAVILNETPYCDPEVDYEAIMVEKNAPRWIKALKKYGFVEKARVQAAA